jgi:uncharacterized tellurite resistance protein B-like protein
MFSDLLSKEEKRALVKTMAYFAHIDGNVTPEEAELLVKAAEKCGMDAKGAWKGIASGGLEQELACLQGDMCKRIVIQELIALGYADGRYFQLEKEAVNRVASILGLDRDTVERIEAWVRQGVEWSRKGYGLIVEGR